MSWVAVAGGAMVVGGGLLGGESERKQASQNAVAPGISAGAAGAASRDANVYSRQALQNYLNAMGPVQQSANQTGTDLRSIFAHYARQLNSGQQSLQGQAARNTQQVANVYQNYGKQAEGVAQQNYGNTLKNIQDQQAIARARQGGQNSGQDMLASGARAQAMMGLNQNLSDIANQRAQLYGGALQSGLNTQLGVGQAGQQLGQNLLGQQMQMRQAAYQIPAGIQQQIAQTQLGLNTSPQELYPNINAWNFLNYGRGPQGTNAAQQIGGGLQGIGSVMMGGGFGGFGGGGTSIGAPMGLGDYPPSMGGGGTYV